MTSRLLTLTEAATSLHLLPAALTIWRKTGYGPPIVLVEGQPHYDRAALDAFKEAREGRTDGNALPLFTRTTGGERR